MQQMLSDPRVNQASVDHILAAWDWLAKNNCLYMDNHQHDKPLLPMETQQVEEETKPSANLLFPQSVIAVAKAGLQASNVVLEGLQPGTNWQGGPQYFHDPDLMVKGFLEVFPFA